MPTVGRVLETSLYVDDLARSIEFYQQLFGFSRIIADDRFCALNVREQQVLLLFRKRATLEPMVFPGGILPPHDGDGQTHLAFTIEAGDEAEWTRSLAQLNVAVESRVVWPAGGFSLYFRDPDGHLLELVSPGCWPFY